MKLKFDSESGVFTIKPESLAETVKLRTSALDIANLLVDYFDADIIKADINKPSNQQEPEMKRIPLKDTERYTVERFKQGKKTERHLAWLKSRKAGVGGSDMSTILGLNSFKTPYELWLEKTGRVEPEDISDKWAIVKGNALENELRKRFRAQHSELLVTDGTDKQFISREKPYLRASLDGILQKENGDFGILEIKTASSRRAGDWHDEDGNLRIPPYYLAQVEFYALVTGWTWGYVYAAIGDDEPVEIPFKADVEDMAAIDEAAADFWHFVTTGTPPQLTAGDVQKVPRAHAGHRGRKRRRSPLHPARTIRERHQNAE